MSATFDAVVSEALRPVGRRPSRPAAAASLILVDRRDGVPRVLMGRRHARATFMPHRWVFPGGRCERADEHAPAQSELSPRTLREVQAAGAAGPKLARALAVAAIRETTEETGLRLGGSGPDLAALRFVARAVTPPVLARRFDARFFEADAGALDGAAPNPSEELDEVGWLTFADARTCELATVTRLILLETERRLRDPERLPLVLRTSRDGRRVTSNSSER